MIELDVRSFPPTGLRREPVSCESGIGVDLALGKVTKGVAAAIGRTLAVDREAAFPADIASLIERLEAGPLGQSKLKPRQVA